MDIGPCNVTISGEIENDRRRVSSDPQKCAPRCLVLCGVDEWSTIILWATLF